MIIFLLEILETAETELLIKHLTFPLNNQASDCEAWIQRCVITFEG